MVLEQGFVRPGAQKPAWLKRKRAAAGDALAEGHAAHLAGY
jgi:Ala-tRNA(Pro) deacylase